MLLKSLKLKCYAKPCPILLYFIASKIEIDRPLTNNAEKVMIYFQDLPTKALAGIFFASE